MSQNEMNYKEEEKLLGRCRDASTRQEQLEAWKNLIAFVKKDNTSHAAKENIARSVLLEWPYSGQVDDLIDACGIVIAVSICTRIFKEWTTVASRTKLPLPSLMEACWTTLQRLALSPINNEKSQQQACYVFVVERIDMLPFVQTLLLLPQIISNACHSQKVRIPWMATPANFYPRLVDCSCQRVVQSSSLENRNHSSTTLLYMETLIKAMLTSRKSEFVAMGLANHHPLSYLSKMDLSPRETSNFLISMLQNCLAHHNDDDKAVLDTCLQILKSCSIDHQEAFVQHVVLSSPKELRLCPLIIHLLDQSGCLYSSLCTISETWSQWTFCHEMDSHQQHYVTQVLLRGLSQLKEEDPTTTDSDDLTLCLLQGVTHRLESSFPQTRRDGMKIAQQVAKRLGQELHFDELLEQQHQKEVDTTVGFLQAAKTSATKSRPTKKKHKVKPRQLDPDADYDSDEDELGASVCSTDDSEQSSRDDDSINVWENDFAPYDLDDAEDDLVETRNPLHLLEALELLRTSENDDHAYSNHETALRCLPDLIQKRPDDLPDVAVSLVLQFLRMENKFNITGFAEMRHQGILQLTIQEPLSVGQHMIEALFRDGSLSDRVNILVALQEAAYELSGSKQIDDREKEKTKK